MNAVLINVFCSPNSAGLALGYTILKQEPSAAYSNNSNYIYLGHLSDGYDLEQSERYLKRCMTYLKLVKSGNAKLQDYGLVNLAKAKKLEGMPCLSF